MVEDSGSFPLTTRSLTKETISSTEQWFGRNIGGGEKVSQPLCTLKAFRRNLVKKKESRLLK